MTQWLERGTAADPGRLHEEGRLARATLEEARDSVAELLGARARQVVLTSGGTEAVNSAVWGAWRAQPSGTMVLSDVEHSSVREASARLGRVERVAVDATGRIEVGSVAETLKRMDKAGTAVSLVHCQLANHEVGTIQPVQEVAELCRSSGALLHVDACAATGHVPVSVDELGADLVSVSAHKLGGPPGAGALVVRRGLRLDPLLVGGEQERARRAGLEDIVAAVGFGAAAAALTGGQLVEERDRAELQRRKLEEAAMAVAGVSVLGHHGLRLPHVLCLAVEGVEAEPVLLGLDRAGIACHSGSSCSSESLAPSAVLEAMGADAERSLRLSVGWSTTDADVEAFAAAFGVVVEDLRALGR